MYTDTDFFGSKFGYCFSVFKKSCTIVPTNTRNTIAIEYITTKGTTN